jgi:hypothetical protein
MNNREKLQAQLDLLQEMKNQFSKDVFIPQGEDYASVQIDRNDKSELRVYADFNQKKFEDDVDRQVDSFFSDFIYEVEKKLEDFIQEEADILAYVTNVNVGSPIVETDEIANSIKK